MLAFDEPKCTCLITLQHLFHRVDTLFEEEQTLKGSICLFKKREAQEQSTIPTEILIVQISNI